MKNTRERADAAAIVGKDKAFQQGSRRKCAKQSQKGKKNNKINS